MVVTVQPYLANEVERESLWILISTELNIAVLQCVFTAR